jgi:Ca2+-transporting ATPase
MRLIPARAATPLRRPSAPTNSPAVGYFSNPWILAAWSLALGLQVAAVYLPVLQTALHTVPLGIRDWGFMLAAAAPVFIIVEGYKVARWWIFRREAQQVT